MKKTKTIKAWAIIWKKPKIFTNDLDEPFGIFDTIKEAERFRARKEIAIDEAKVLWEDYQHRFEIIPCKITYEI